MYNKYEDWAQTPRRSGSDQIIQMKGRSGVVASRIVEAMGGSLLEQKCERKGILTIFYQNGRCGWPAGLGCGRRCAGLSVFPSPSGWQLSQWRNKEIPAASRGIGFSGLYWREARGCSYLSTLSWCMYRTLVRIEGPRCLHVSGLWAVGSWLAHLAFAEQRGTRDRRRGALVATGTRMPRGNQRPGWGGSKERYFVKDVLQVIV